MLDFIKEIFYTLLNFSIGIFTKKSSCNFRKVVDGNNGNILIIRGFGNKPSLPEIRIEKAMRNKNIGGLFAGISPKDEELDHYIPQLEKEIEKFNKKIVLVGLSLGGLIALRYIYTNGWSNKILGVITVASPLNGVKLLKLTNQKTGMSKDLKKESGVLKQIREIGSPRSKIIHIFAKWDQFTGDPNQINTTGKKIILQIGGHNNLLCNPELPLIIIKIAKTYNNIINT